VNLLRKSMDRPSRGRVFTRHLPEKCGSVPILVSPDATLSFWKLRGKSDLFDFAREFMEPGSVVWDVARIWVH